MIKVINQRGVFFINANYVFNIIYETFPGKIDEDLLYRLSSKLRINSRCRKIIYLFSNLAIRPGSECIVTYCHFGKLGKLSLLMKLVRSTFIISASRFVLFFTTRANKKSLNFHQKSNRTSIKKSNK